MTSHAVEHELTEQAKAAAGIMEVLRARDQISLANPMAAVPPRNGRLPWPLLR